MTTYVTDAVTRYLAGMRDRGLVAARPIRVDGLVEAEIDEALPRLKELVAPGRIAVLDVRTSLHRDRIDPDRATRYRNEIDAGVNRGFVLLVPHGQVPESSLNEPAFLVVRRDPLFREALARRRVELDLTRASIEGIRQAARYRQAESIFAFLSAWEDQSGAIDPAASFEHLGLLAHGGLGGASEMVIERLARNAKACELIARPGLSPSRLVDELVAKVELDAGLYRDEVVVLARWWQAGRAGASPHALDFAEWPLRTDFEKVEVTFERDLRRPPHKGWKEVGGEAVVDSEVPTATLEWQADVVPADARFVVQLVEATTQTEVVPTIGGKTTRTRRSIRWSSVLKGDDLLEQLKSLDAAGEEAGYSFVLRLLLVRGAAILKQFDSLPFIARVKEGSDDVGATASSTLYHALYQFHADQRADSPRVVSWSGAEGRARLEGENGRTRDAAIDVSGPLIEIERRILSSPEARGPFVFRPGKHSEGSLEWSATGSILTTDLPDQLVLARKRLLESIADDLPLEMLPGATSHGGRSRLTTWRHSAMRLGASRSTRAGQEGWPPRIGSGAPRCYPWTPSR